MTKILVIAWREFLATVATKGFIIGLILPPALMVTAITLIPLLMNKASPKVAGHIAVIDQSGVVAPRLETAFSAEEIAKRRSAKIVEGVKVASNMAGLDEKAAKDAAAMAASQSASTPQLAAPTLRVQVLPTDTDSEAAKKELLKATGREQSSQDADARLALLVVPKESVFARTDAEAGNMFAGYQFFVAPRLDPEVQDDIRDQVSRAIVDARLTADGLEVDRVRRLIARPSAETKAVTKEGERKTNEAAAFLIPGGFMLLLWISIFTAGQYLLAGTIEEKSNRVMEVLLSAASPMELMVGKILGKGAVGGLIMLLYSGVGIAALVAFALQHLIEPQTLILVAVYFVFAYFTIACMMAAIGAAVTEVTEAQSLLGPVMMVLVIPMMLWMPILRNPNSGFAQACSFVPLINPFVMVLRISGSEPIPTWQIPVSLLVAAGTVVVMALTSAKIFRIGVLMYGKPPNFATLIRWVRMA